MTGEATGEIRTWSLLGVKGLIAKQQKRKTSIADWQKEAYVLVGSVEWCENHNRDDNDDDDHDDDGSDDDDDDDANEDDRDDGEWWWWSWVIMLMIMLLMMTIMIPNPPVSIREPLKQHLVHRLPPVADGRGEVSFTLLGELRDVLLSPSLLLP